MGLLDWRGWDRLDEFDRRTGLQREWTEASVVRTQRFLWAVTAVVLLAAAVNAIQGDWGSAVVNGAFAAPGFVINPWAIRRIRKRAGLG